tara:strand:- start:67 stop:351 length:285 start_codon:yes stop_codon:yes gene_type:complete
MSTNLLKALNSFDGFRGASMPTNPTNQEEFSALVNAVDGGSCWSGVVPTWEQVQAKVAEYDAEDQTKVDTKASAKAKLIAGEPLTEDEADTIVL